ncbi:hypothetical protein [Providencia rettgeri]|uniref:hypothetical protein n=1 Tax=Providencia rettgeri TaxID=587 RepID=UPI002362B049|nr:hypothetical protein [Providencia rettgeri]
MSNQNEGEFSGVVFVNSGPSLEERVTTLEKQLTDMQAAMSCDLSVANTSMLQVRAAIEASEQAFRETLNKLQSRFDSSMEVGVTRKSQ